MKTGDQIAAEVEALRAIKPSVRKTNVFGDNHHDAIDAQITALLDLMDEDEVHGRHENAAEDEEFHSKNERDAALEAVWWSKGDEQIAPSESWRELAS